MIKTYLRLLDLYRRIEIFVGSNYEFHHIKEIIDTALTVYAFLELLF